VGFTKSTDLRNSVQFLYEIKGKLYSAIRENQEIGIMVINISRQEYIE
jgi:hypothetical protein